MAKLDWGNGTGIGLHFNNDEEYYEVLGFLSKKPSDVVAYTHENDISGAWSGQGKLETKIGKSQLPAALYRSFVQSGDNRLSVSDYVENLVYNHAFSNFYDPTGNQYTFYIFPESYEAVRNTVPQQYLRNFNIGYNM
jgi:hypothetical protein